MNNEFAAWSTVLAVSTISMTGCMPINSSLKLPINTNNVPRYINQGYVESEISLDLLSKYCVCSDIGRILIKFRNSVQDLVNFSSSIDKIWGRRAKLVLSDRNETTKLKIVFDVGKDIDKDLQKGEQLESIWYRDTLYNYNQDIIFEFRAL